MCSTLGQDRVLVTGMSKALVVRIVFLLGLAIEAHRPLAIVAIEVCLIGSRDLRLDQVRHRGEIVRGLDHIVDILDRPDTFLTDISQTKPVISKRLPNRPVMINVLMY